MYVIYVCEHILAAKIEGICPNTHVTCVFSAINMKLAQDINITIEDICSKCLTYYS